MHQDDISEKIKTKSVLTFLMSIVTVLICVYFYLFHAYHNFVIDRLALEVKGRLENSTPLFLKRVDEFYKIIGDYITADPEVLDAFLKQNRQALYERVIPIFNTLKAHDMELEAMQFHTIDGYSLLRMHNPQYHSDNLKERKLIARILSSGEPISAIDAGKYSLSYRIGIPIYDGPLCVGALEFGVRPDLFSRMLLEESNVKSAIFMERKNIKIFLDNNKNFDKEDSAIKGYIAYRDFGNLIENESEWEKSLENYLYKQDKNNHHIIFKGLELKDVDGERIGYLMIDKNIDYYMKRALKLKIISILIGAVLWVAVFCLLCFGYYRYLVRMKHYEDSIIEKNKILEHLSLFDHLTTIANRRNIEEHFMHAIDRFSLKLVPFSMVIFDIDDFKRINDTYGHSTGDEVIKDVARIAKSSIRDDDMVGRWGGEEFVLYLPCTSIESAFLVAERLREAIEAHKFDDRFRITCSFGVSEFRTGMNFDELVTSADEALYKAKRDGKNRVMSATETKELLCQS